MKKVVAAILMATIMLGVFMPVASASRDDIEDMQRIETDCKSMLDALCTVYEIAGIGMFNDEYTEKLYRYYKLYYAAQTIEQLEMMSEIKKAGKETSFDHEEWESTLILLEKYVDNQWEEYTTGKITQKEYLDFMADFVRGQIGESVFDTEK